MLSQAHRELRPTLITIKRNQLELRKPGEMTRVVSHWLAMAPKTTKQAGRDENMVAAYITSHESVVPI